MKVFNIGNIIMNMQQLMSLSKKERLLILNEKLSYLQKELVECIAYESRPKNELMEALASFQFTLSLMASKNDLDPHVIECRLKDKFDEITQKENKENNKIVPFKLVGVTRG